MSRGVIGNTSGFGPEEYRFETCRDNKSYNMKSFLKFLIIWISQNLAIPFWVVGHIHLSIHNFHDLVEIGASIGMNLIVAIGFFIDYKENGSN